MIKVGIEGGDTPIAGELIRILINHPDVIISAISCSEMAGIPVSVKHHGLIGEGELKFTRNIDYDSIDTLFICRPDSRQSREQAYANPNLNVIDLSENRDSGVHPDIVFGLSEIYRKNMVRGAKKIIVPTSVESMALVALYPLACNLLLSDTIEIKGSVPADLIIENLNVGKVISTHLAAAQQSFASDIVTEITPSEHRRVAEMSIMLNCAISSDQIRQIYDGMYNDHNFTFMADRKPDTTEVNGTEKCIFYISRPTPERLDIDVIADARMRGGAGEAVHILNLLHGLHEKTGLSLKTSDF